MGACSSLIKMHHQISTGSQTLNEASSPGTVVGHSAAHPARWKDKVLRTGSTWKQEPGVGGTLSLCDASTMQRPHTRSLAGGWWAPWLLLLLRQLQGFKRYFGKHRERSVEKKGRAKISWVHTFTQLNSSKAVMGKCCGLWNYDLFTVCDAQVTRQFYDHITAAVLWL